MGAFLEEVRQYVKDRNASYFNRKVRSIEGEIRAAALRGSTEIWVTFEWDDGDYKPIIEYFESEGVEVTCPTGTDDGDFTSYKFTWTL